MIGDIARRSLAKAAEKHAELQAAAAGDEASKAVATQLLTKKRENPHIAYGYTLPQDEGGEFGPALLAVAKNENKKQFTNTQMAIAGLMVAADLVATAGLDPPRAFQNLGRFAKAVLEANRIQLCNGAQVFAKAVSRKQFFSCEMGRRFLRPQQDGSNPSLRTGGSMEWNGA